MADKKISALPAATTPLAGTEVLPIVQGGTTVKVSIDNLTTGKVVTTGPIISVGAGKDRLVIEPQNAGSGALLLGTNAAGNAYTPVLMDGAYTQLNVGGSEVARTNSNGIAPVAGKGIDFSANTHAAGMTSEVLTWYEEGTWTPVVFFGGANTGMNVAVSGHYTRIGRLVTVRCSVVFTAKGSSTGTFQISGLPYSGSIPGSGTMGFNYGWATMPSGGMTFAAISGSIYAMPANFGEYADDTYFGNGTAINDITITYMV